jgi:hypothetical protein
MKQFIITIILLLHSTVLLADNEYGNLRSVVSKTFESFDLDASEDELFSLGVWSDDRHSYIVHYPNGLDSIMIIFLAQDDKSYLPVNLSYLVNSKFNGKLGRDREFYDRYEQEASLSTDWTDYIVGVSITTRAWKSGQRYTVTKKPVLIKRNGETLKP